MYRIVCGAEKVFLVLFFVLFVAVTTMTYLSQEREVAIPYSLQVTIMISLLVSYFVSVALLHVVDILERRMTAAEIAAAVEG